MQEQKKGVLKRLMGEIEIKDMELSNIVTDCLLDKGYEIAITPIKQDGSGFPMGEKLLVYRVEERCTQPSRY